MKEKKKLFFQIAANILLSALFLLYFGRNCSVRPAAYPCAYKEFLSGVIVLATVYFNVFVLVPRILSGLNFLRYTLLCFISIIVSTAAEMAMVYPQVIALLTRQFPVHFAYRYFFHAALLVMFRNIGINSFVFLFIALKNEMRLGRMRNGFWVKRHGSLVLTNSKNMLFEVPIDHVEYCEKCGNQTRFHLTDGNTGFLNCSLNDIASMMGRHGVQISRSIFVMLRHIAAFDPNKITLKKGNGETITLSISKAYATRVSQQLGSPLNTAENPEKPADEVLQDFPESPTTTDETLGPKPALIYAFIKESPLCSAEDIMAQTDLSRSSVAKYIARLKQQGLIEHVGANKTGGYRIVERLEMRD